METSSIGKHASLLDFVESMRRQHKEAQVVLDQLLIESISKVLETTFGKEAANIIKRNINIASTSREKGSFDPQIFSENLEKLLGAGAKLIELEIIRNFS